MVPDLYHRGLAEADYMIRNLGLVPEYTVVTQPDKCWVILQDPQATTIVAVGSTVKFTVARSASDCGP